MTNKEWTTAAQFSVYEEADSFRKELFDKHSLVKVRRGLRTFRVKVWDPPPEKRDKKGKKKNANKNKKVRN
jgi:hypothetical protein